MTNKPEVSPATLECKNCGAKIKWMRFILPDPARWVHLAYGEQPWACGNGGGTYAEPK